MVNKLHSYLEKKIEENVICGNDIFIKYRNCSLGIVHSMAAVEKSNAAKCVQHSTNRTF